MDTLKIICKKLTEMVSLRDGEPCSALETMTSLFCEIEEWLQAFKQDLEYMADEPKRWSQEMLTSGNLVILAIDFDQDGTITGVLAMDANGSVLLESSVGSDGVLLKQGSAVTEMTVQDAHLTSPSWSRIWSSLREIIINAHPYLISGCVARNIRGMLAA